MLNMTGRPGYRTMEMNGGSAAPYLACTPCVPLFCTLLEGLLDCQGRPGIICIVRWKLRPVIFGVESGLLPKSPELAAADLTTLREAKNVLKGPKSPTMPPHTQRACRHSLVQYRQENQTRRASTLQLQWLLSAFRNFAAITKLPPRTGNL